MVEDDGKADMDAGVPMPEEQPDLYYHGIIRRLSPRKGTGVVRTASGRDVRFSYQMVLVSGSVKSPKGLREGMVVGYDLGWTSHGLRVVKMRTYPQRDWAPGGRGRDPDRLLAGRQGQGQDLAGQELPHEDSEQGDVE